jgi:hypothetical protein
MRHFRYTSPVELTLSIVFYMYVYGKNGCTDCIGMWQHVAAAWLQAGAPAAVCCWSLPSEVVDHCSARKGPSHPILLAAVWAGGDAGCPCVGCRGRCG